MGLSKIKSPVKGDWSFMNPPGHHPDAKDFVAVDQNGKPYEVAKVIRHLCYKLSVEDTYSWEKKIFSPFEAEVIAVKNDAKDRMTLNIFRDLVNGLIIAPKNGKNDVEYFLGNYIILKSEKAEFALLAHLRQGSVLVSKGMKVKTGEIIAKVGNSGNTIQPHLHFQIMKESDPAKAIPIPFTFEYSQVCDGKTEGTMDSTLPKNWKKFRV
ncbi:MAG: M23 family metallopeptidase [Gammaproteobacteria bacterium]|nr:M23 family metallopeptidase [Gammaproteobacteria bacterium]